MCCVPPPPSNCQLSPLCCSMFAGAEEESPLPAASGLICVCMLMTKLCLLGLCMCGCPKAAWHGREGGRSKAQAPAGETSPSLPPTQAWLRWGLGWVSPGIQQSPGAGTCSRGQAGSEWNETRQAQKCGACRISPPGRGTAKVWLHSQTNQFDLRVWTSSQVAPLASRRAEG